MWQLYILFLFVVKCIYLRDGVFMNTTISTSFRIEKSKLERIDALASHMKRSRNWHINEAMENFLAYNKWFVKEVEKGLNDAAKGNFATDEEVSSVFRKYGA